MSSHSMPPQSTVPARLTIAALGLDRAPVLEIHGEEEIGRLPRFSIGFAAADIDPAPVVGAAARVVIGERVVGGVIADIESLDEIEDGIFEHRITLAPRAFLLSRGRASRTFSGLGTPEIIEAVIAASGIDVRVEARLREDYPARPSTVQHRESDLDFILRIAERDGISIRVEDDGEVCTLLLSDHNDALPSIGILESASGVRRKSELLPRRVDLVSFDPGRPELPLRASAVVSENGAGELEIHDLPFSTPEEGARAARREAERIRACATVIEGAVKEPIPAGIRAVAKGREIVVARARHALSREGVWTSVFSAIPASVPFRPERRIASPAVSGLACGRLSPGVDRARVRDLEGVDLDDEREVVWGCLDGDPERPIITAVLPSSNGDRRNVMRGPRGAIFEMGGAPPLGEVTGTLDGARVPAVAHHSDGETSTYTSGTGSTDTWMRFGVPHYSGTSTSGWSYLRIGEAATDATALSAPDGSTFGESSDKCIGLKVNSYSSSGLAGVFDFTDKNRTNLTKGDYEQIVKGTARIALHGGRATPHYSLDVGKHLVSENINNASFNYTDGTALDIFGGLKVDATIGTKVEASLGGNFNFDLGFMFNATAGYKLDYVHADSYEVRKGEELSSASTLDKRASEKIQFSIHAGGGSVDKETKIAAAIAVAAAAAIAITADATEAFDDEDGYTAIATGIVGLAMIATFATMRYRSLENELEDGKFIFSMDSTTKRAALRSDDWLLLMSEDYAILGKNKKFSEEPKVVNLTDGNAGTAIVLEEEGYLRLQTVKTGTTVLGLISMEEDKVIIKAKSLEIEAADGVKIAGPVTIAGKLTVSQDGLEVTGDTKLAGALDAANGVLKVAP